MVLIEVLKQLSALVLVDVRRFPKQVGYMMQLDLTSFFERRQVHPYLATNEFLGRLDLGKNGLTHHGLKPNPVILQNDGGFTTEWLHTA